MAGLTQARLRELLNYNPETGVFTWLVSRGRIASGQIAGTYANGYRGVRVEGKRFLAHRLAWLYIHSVWPKLDLDHINGVTSDNRISNLRQATKSQNQTNSKKPRNNTSGFKGVYWSKQHKHWIAQISVRGKHHHIGLFKSPEAAHAAYCAAVQEHYGEFARTE